MQNNKNTNILPLIIIFLLILILAGGAFWYGRQTKIEENNEKIAEQEKSKESTSSKEVKNIEEIKQEDTEGEIIAALSQAFSVKYNRPVEDVYLTINKRKGDYITGGVRFGEEMGGGYVLGAKVNGEWKIIADGNGIVSCSAVDEVDFPTEFNPECWNTTTNEIVDRTTGQVKTY